MIRRFFLALLWATALVNLALYGPQTGANRLQQPEAPPDAEASVRFLAFGDMGTGDREQYALAKQMTAWHDESGFDTVLLLGDNIYPDGNPKDIPAKFEKPYAELLVRGVKFYASLGNHDVKKGREAQINYPNFNMGGRAYYSFTKAANGHELVEFFALDSTNFDAAQQRWLEGALTRSNATWKLAFFHHPLYSSGRTHGSYVALRSKLEPMFVRHGVAAVFSGHDHIYERTAPQQGVQYFVAGAASGKLRRGDINRRSQFFAAGNDEANSFLALEATRDRLSFRAMDAAGKAFDSGAISPVTARPAPLSISTPLRIPPRVSSERSAPSMNGDSSSGGDRVGGDPPSTESGKDAHKREERERRNKEKEEKRAKEKELKELKRKQKDSSR